MEHGVSWLSFIPGYHQLEAMLRQEAPPALLGQPIVIQHVLTALLVAFIAMFIAWRVRSDIRQSGAHAAVPNPEISIRNVTEVLLEWLYGQMRLIIGPDAKRYFPIIATLGMFIFISNMIGLIPGFVPPTDNWNTTFACSISVFLYYNWHGVRVHGWGHLAHLANPIGTWWGWFMAPLMLPVELISHCARPFSLAVRLASNMIGDHAVLLAFLGLMPFLVPIPFMLLGMIVCVVQTVVFVLLSTIFVSLAVADSHADDHHGDEHAAAAA